MEETRALEPEEELNLMDYIAVIMEYRKMIVIFCTITVLVTAVISLLLPKVYKATVSILPPKTEGTLPGMRGEIASLVDGALGIKSGADLYVGMLKSRTIADALIDRFDLKVYKVKYRWVAMNTLKVNTNVNKSPKEEIITVSVEDKDPKRAAEMGPMPTLMN